MNKYVHATVLLARLQLIPVGIHCHTLPTTCWSCWSIGKRI